MKSIEGRKRMLGIGGMVGIEYERNFCNVHVAFGVALLEFVEYTATRDVPLGCWLGFARIECQL